MSMIDEGKLQIVLEGLKQGEFPIDTKHLIHEILQLKKVELVVDKDKCMGGDLALKGDELTTIDISMVIVDFESETKLWELNPIQKFGLLIGSAAVPSVKNLIKSMPDYIESTSDGNYYCAGNSMLVHLMESLNDQGILIAYKKTEKGAELMIEDCSVPIGVQVWLRNVSSKLDA